MATAAHAPTHHPRENSVPPPRLLGSLPPVQKLASKFTFWDCPISETAKKYNVPPVATGAVWDGDPRALLCPGGATFTALNPGCW